MKCQDCGKELDDGEECFAHDDIDAERPLCGACLVDKHLPPAAPSARTRKPRADRGQKRGPRAGPFILQGRQADDLAWIDVDGAATETKAWACCTSAGIYRVVRQHGRDRTAAEQTAIRWE